MPQPAPVELRVERVPLARIFGIDPRTVNRLVDEGMPVARHGRGRQPAEYDVARCVQWYVERERAKLLGNKEGVSPQKERALLDRVRREEAQLRLRRASGELVPVDEAARDFNECAAAVKARMRRVPDGCIDRLLAAGSVHQARAVLLAEIDEALRELAHRGEQLGKEDPAA